MISSRRQKNVDAAVEQLKKENLAVEGVVCHVAKHEDRQKLLNEVKLIFKSFFVCCYFLCNMHCFCLF